MPIVKDKDSSVYLTSLNTDDVPTQVSIGDNVKFLPNLLSAKWGGEAWLSMVTPVSLTAQQETLVDGRLELVVGDIRYRYYITEDGRIEYEIGYASRPASDQVIMNLDFSDGMRFLYQDTPENEYAKGHWPETTLEEFLESFNRPEDVIGSYAVYWNRANNEKKTGKFCHITAPYIIDSNGNRKKCPISIVDKLLTISLDKKWLDNAAYPVILDPTIGYSSQGSSSYGNSTTHIGTVDNGNGTNVTDASGGDISTYHFYLSARNVNDNVKLAVYPCGAGAGNPRNTAIVSQVEFTTTAVGLNEMAGSGTLAASTEYAVLGITENNNTKIAGDTGSSGDGIYASGRVYADEFPSTYPDFSPNSTDWLMSQWVTYGGGASAPIAQAMHHYKMLRD